VYLSCMGIAALYEGCILLLQLSLQIRKFDDFTPAQVFVMVESWIFDLRELRGTSESQIAVCRSVGLGVYAGASALEG